jgi:hypothetical protein
MRSSVTQSSVRKPFQSRDIIFQPNRRVKILASMKLGVASPVLSFLAEQFVHLCLHIGVRANLI